MIEPVQKDGEFLRDVVTTCATFSTSLNLWWLGQSGFLVGHGGRTLAFDPYLSDSLTAKYAGTEKPHVRMTGQVIWPAALAFTNLRVVTSSHHHTDHLDPETLQPLLREAPWVSLFVPEAHRKLAAKRAGGRRMRISGMRDGDTSHIDGFTLTAVPAAHDRLDTDADGNHLYLGYVLRADRWTVYHSGDTVVYEGMVDRFRPFNIDLAILPINGKVGNMGGRDAARLAKDIGAKLVVPCHYEMFEFNTADPRDEFIPECERLGQPYKVLRAGERLTLGA